VTRSRSLVLALAINLVLAVGLVFAGRAAHSTGLVADAGHNLTDAVAVGLALLASLLAVRPASERRSFGYQRSTILAALANGIVLVAITVSIVWLAVYRLLHPQAIHGGIVLVAASLSLVANLAVVLVLRQESSDLGIKSALVHSLGDALSAGVVAMAGALTLIIHGPVALRIDPCASLIVAGFIVVEAIRITGTSIQVLLEGVPSDVDLSAVRTCLRQLDGVEAVHDLHVWSLSTEARAMSAHLVIAGDPRLTAVAPLIEAARHELDERFGIAHATFELESGPCADQHPHA
jgi:cobalt-zinc-cadmium efflux system protein